MPPYVSPPHAWKVVFTKTRGPDGSPIPARLLKATDPTPPGWCSVGYKKPPLLPQPAVDVEVGQLCLALFLERPPKQARQGTIEKEPRNLIAGWRDEAPPLPVVQLVDEPEKRLANLGDARAVVSRVRRYGGQHGCSFLRYTAAIEQSMERRTDGGGPSRVPIEYQTRAVSCG